MINIVVSFKNYKRRKSNKLNTTNNNIDKKVSIDTMILRVKLTDEQKEFIYDRFYYGFHRSKHYRYSLYFEEMGFTLQLSPKKSVLHSYFNGTITLHRKFFQREYIPHSIIDILTSIDWSIVRIDIAFDYKTSKQDSLLFKHHGNSKDASYENETYYIGNHKSQKKSHTLVNYDRNIKEIKRGTGIEHEYGNRLETRFKFKMADMKLNNMNQELIYNQLKKYLFLSNIDQLNTNGYRKNRIRKMQHKYKQLTLYDKKEAATIKELIKASREPLEEIYKLNITNLFSFIEYKEVYVIESAILKEAIE
ncbi:hypothetical protein B0H99_103294 [Planomicrobium soli]|uniref:Replication initiation factor n=1 Tax=Planomicrobium soli TaxID=1176648 RepID=A0A2P8H4L5_9BACL|nr:hypothetical protein [Planomicrobium soli]PSL41158.1 hypothetical protein B0H99_103294 [Planomicrobium soli]